HIGDDVQAANRNGEETTLDDTIAAALKHAPAGTILDGEVVPESSGPVYRIFDLLADAGTGLLALPYTERYARLEVLCAGLAPPIVLVKTARTTKQKQALLSSLDQLSAEGIVFKQLDAPYTSGRPASGGAQLKFKLVKSADVFITENQGNAYQMAVYHNGKPQEVGKVFAGTSNETRRQLDDALIAKKRTVVEVRYLYATEADLLFQPVFVRIRSDKAPRQCVLSQLSRTNRDAVGTY
ncbi:MAG: bifunctional non-homologous end joining protein LigD, partial [Myxococcota bacterium]